MSERKPINVDLSAPKPGSPDELLASAPQLARNRSDAFPTSIGIENQKIDSVAQTLPRLLNDKRVRFDPFTGKIYISSWRRVPIKDNADQLEMDLGDKKPKTRALLRWSRWNDIESAIRGAKHIVTKHGPDGEVTDNLNTVLDLASALFDGFSQGEITPENLQEHLDEAYTILEDNKLLKPNAPNRIKLKALITGALQRDSVGRFNPLISRTKLAASTIRLLEEKLIAGQAQEKYNYLLVSLLTIERMTERFYIQQVIEQAREFLNIPNEHPEITEAAKRFRRFANTFLHPDVIKVAPYRSSALFFLVLSFGFPNFKRKEWTKLFSSMFSEELIPQIDEMHTGQKDGSEESLDIFRRRLENGIEVLEKTLESGERNLESKAV